MPVNPVRRRTLLELCARAGGYSPTGADWPTVYWLHARGMLEALQPHRLKPPMFVITELGRAAMADERALA